MSARLPDSDLVVIRAFPAGSLERVEAADLMVIDLDGNMSKSCVFFRNIHEDITRCGIGGCIEDEIDVE